MTASTSTSCPCSTPTGTKNNRFALCALFSFFAYNRYTYTFTHDRLWRKTRSHLGRNTNCRGVDPNRNWGYGYAGLGASVNPCRETYRGEKAFSEPETLLTSKFIKLRANQMKVRGK